MTPFVGMKIASFEFQLNFFDVTSEKIISENVNNNVTSDEIRYLTMTDASRIWMPDTFFRNEKFGSFHKILQPNLYIRIYPDGTILYSIRYLNK